MVTMFKVAAARARRLLAAGLLASGVFAATGALAIDARLPAALTAGAATTAPIGWVQFCRDNADECRDNRNDVVGETRLDRDNWAVLTRINRQVNEAIAPVSDMDHHGVTEFWTYPADGKGDCEEYVLLKRKLLMEAGFARSNLLITVVRQKNGEGHAVLTVKTDRGDYILDNQADEIMLWSKTDYRFIKRQSEANQSHWVSLGTGAAPAYTANRE